MHGDPFDRCRTIGGRCDCRREILWPPVRVAQQDCASVVCSAKCGAVSVLPSPLCDPAGLCYGSLHGSEKKGVGSETKKKWLYVRHLPIGLFGQINEKCGGQYSMFLASGTFRTFKNYEKGAVLVSGWRNLPGMCGLACRLSPRVFGVHNSCLVFFFFFCGSFIYDKGARDPFLSRPSTPPAPPWLSWESLSGGAVVLSLSLQRGVYINSASKVHKPPLPSWPHYLLS